MSGEEDDDEDDADDGEDEDEDEEDVLLQGRDIITLPRGNSNSARPRLPPTQRPGP